ncbi:hypothetical protein [Streptomyces sp. NPDC093071]|uniref:hypothetical protein n=1 Tax=Streptomyces sp. NPDC093071 TaxID=3366022 RepID=UPI003809D387
MSARSGPVGSTVAVWRGGLDNVVGRHRAEWTVAGDILLGRNTRSFVLAEPGVSKEADQVVLRGLLQLTGDGTAVLRVGDSQVLSDAGSPPPPDNAWVEGSVEADEAALHPHAL